MARSPGPVHLPHLLLLIKTAEALPQALLYLLLFNFHSQLPTTPILQARKETQEVKQWPSPSGEAAPPLPLLGSGPLHSSPGHTVRPD